MLCIDYVVEVHKYQRMRNKFSAQRLLPLPLTEREYTSLLYSLQLKHWLKLERLKISTGKYLEGK